MLNVSSGAMKNTYIFKSQILFRKHPGFQLATNKMQTKCMCVLGGWWWGKCVRWWGEVFDACVYFLIFFCHFTVGTVWAYESRISTCQWECTCFHGYEDPQMQREGSVGMWCHVIDFHRKVTSYFNHQMILLSPNIPLASEVWVLFFDEGPRRLSGTTPCHSAGLRGYVCWCTDRMYEETVHLLHLTVW